MVGKSSQPRQSVQKKSFRQPTMSSSHRSFGRPTQPQPRLASYAWLSGCGGKKTQFFRIWMTLRFSDVWPTVTKLFHDVRVFLRTRFFGIAANHSLDHFALDAHISSSARPSGPMECSATARSRWRSRCGEATWGGSWGGAKSPSALELAVRKLRNEITA
jgi:hypothetical protein